MKHGERGFRRSSPPDSHCSLLPMLSPPHLRLGTFGSEPSFQAMHLFERRMHLIVTSRTSFFNCSHGPNRSNPFPQFLATRHHRWSLPVLPCRFQFAQLPLILGNVFIHFRQHLDACYLVSLNLLTLLARHYPLRVIQAALRLNTGQSNPTPSKHSHIINSRFWLVGESSRICVRYFSQTKTG